MPKKWINHVNKEELASITKELVKIFEESEEVKPFWNSDCKNVSEKIWLPDNLNVNSNANIGNSWFNIEEKKNGRLQPTENINFQHPPSLKLEKSKLKTIKFRLFPNKEEIEKLDEMFDQFRWYYNATVTILYKHYNNLISQKKYSAITIRDLVRKYNYSVIDNKQEFTYDESRNAFPTTTWWPEVHNKVPRGAINKLTYALNSALSNLKAGNISKFKMSFKSKKDPFRILSFEDAGFPRFIKNISSRYFFTDKKRKRNSVTLADVFKESPRGLELSHDKKTNHYYVYYPIETNWYPDQDRRNDRQTTSTGKVIALDPGVRKFLVGYDPSGKSIYIGDGSNKLLTALLLKIDKIKKDVDKIKLWKRINGLVSELHWKTIRYLTLNYDTIIIPDFKISKMVRNKCLPKITKRLLYMFRFHEFKTKLMYKCGLEGKKIILVNEAYTSCTCTGCGVINTVKGNETFNCTDCKLTLDRDSAGSRNIFIKHTRTLNESK